MPVVVDLETGGFNSETDALLELAMVILDMDEDGTLFIRDQVHAHIEPFEGANLEPAALEFTGIDPYHPLRMAESEKDALTRMFKPVRDAIKHHGCNRAVLVGHNAHFDLGFLNQAIKRSGIKRVASEGAALLVVCCRLGSGQIKRAPFGALFTSDQRPD